MDCKIYEEWHDILTIRKAKQIIRKRDKLEQVGEGSKIRGKGMVYTKEIKKDKNSLIPLDIERTILRFADWISFCPHNYNIIVIYSLIIYCLYDII